MSEAAALTEQERAQMNCDCAKPYGWTDHVLSCFVPVVESILAARLADSRPVVSEAAITDEAVEAAAEAEWKLSYADTRPWSMATQDLADEYRKGARAALTAALPHMGDGKGEA